MKDSLKKRGQKFIRKFSRVSAKVGEEGKEHLKENFFGRIQNVRNIRLLILEWGLLVLALIMLASTQAFWFGESYAGDAFIGGGTFIEGTIGKVTSLNPLYATTNSEKSLSRLMFESLVKIDYSGNVGMGLAKSITPNEDGKEWVVSLREGLKWSDGDDLTTSDVMFTIDLIKNPAVNSVYSANLAGVKVKLNEENKIVFTLPTAYADFPSALVFPIVPEHILAETDPKILIENDFSNQPTATSGVFSFNAIQVAAKEEKVFYLTPNPNYYKKGASVSNFAVHTFENKDDVIKALNSSTITASAELSGEDVDKVTSKQFYHKDSNINTGAFIFFNTGNGAFKDKKLRVAARQGIDLTRLREMAPGTAALDFPILESSLRLYNYPVLPENDYEAAKKVLNEAIKEETIINIATVNSGYLPKVAEELKNQLAELGVNAEVSVSEEGQEFITNIISRRNYDILVYEIELGANPDPLAYYHSSQASSGNETSPGLNLSNYKNALMDDLLIGARETLNKELRIAKYEKVLQYIIDDVPTIGLYQPNMTYFYNKNTRVYSDYVRITTPLDRFSDVTNYAVTKELKNKTP